MGSGGAAHEREFGPAQDLGEIGIVEGLHTVSGVLPNGERQELSCFRDLTFERQDGGGEVGHPFVAAMAAAAPAEGECLREVAAVLGDDRLEIGILVGVGRAPVGEPLVAESEILTRAFPETGIIVGFLEQAPEQSSGLPPVLLMSGGDGASEELELRIGLRVRGRRAFRWA